MEEREIKEFKILIEEAIRNLKDGDSRLGASWYPINDNYFNEDFRPYRDDDSIGNNEKVEADYYEEIALIEKLLVEANVPIHLSKWQISLTKIQPENEENIKKERRLQYAIQLWNWYAIPWRYKDNRIHIIWTPSLDSEKPTIGSYHRTNDFLKSFSWVLMKREDKQNKILKQLNYWKSYGIMLSLIIIVFILIKFL